MIQRQLRPVENFHALNDYREHEGRRAAFRSRKNDDHHFTGTTL